MRRVIPFIMLATFAACNGSGPTSSGGGDAQLAVLNALTTTEAVTLHLDGSLFPIPSTGQSAGVPIPGGSHTITLKAVDGRVLANANFAVSPGNRRTAVVAGSALNSYSLVVAIDTASLPPANAMKIRVVHMAEGAEEMDAQIYLAALPADSASNFVSPFRFGTGLGKDFPGYATRPAGTYTVRVVTPGTTNVLAAINIPTFTGEVWSMILSWTPDHQLQWTAVREGGVVLY